MELFQTTLRNPNNGYFTSDTDFAVSVNHRTRERILRRLNLLNTILTPISASNIALEDLGDLNIEARKVGTSDYAEKITFTPALFSPQPSHLLARYPVWELHLNDEGTGTSLSLREPATLDWDSGSDDVGHGSHVEDVREESEAEARHSGYISLPSWPPHPQAYSTTLLPTYVRIHLAGDIRVANSNSDRHQNLSLRRTSGTPSLDLGSTVDEKDNEEGDGYGGPEVRIEDVDKSVPNIPVTAQPDRIDPGQVLLRHARRMHESIAAFINAPRVGIGAPYGQRYGALGDLVPFTWRCGGHYPPQAPNADCIPSDRRLDERLIRYAWECEDVYTHDDHADTIITVTLGSVGSDNTLSLPELKAAVRFLLTQYGLPQFADSLTISVLVIAYMGSGHGRISQAYHNGEKLVVQYSPLMAFDLDGPSPVSLFARYTLARPVL